MREFYHKSTILVKDNNCIQKFAFAFIFLRKSSTETAESFPTVQHKTSQNPLGNGQGLHADANLLVGLNEGGDDTVVAEIISGDFHYVNPHTTTWLLFSPNLLRLKL